MQRKMRIFAFLLALLLGVSSLASCAADESEEELLTIAQALTESSVLVNELIFGEGILSLEDGYSISSYSEADPIYLEKYGVSSLADIEAKISSVYAAATASWIKTTVLSSVKQDGQVLTYARYYDGTKTVNEEEVPVLMVKNNHERMMYGTPSYSNYKIVKSRKEEVIFTVDITVSDGETVKNFKESKITMRKENDVWRLDSTTYASVK